MWRDIPKWEGLYQASDAGQIRSLEFRNNRGVFRREKVLKQHINKHKRCYVTLYAPDGRKKNCTVHRLIALAFIPNPDSKPQINHKDGNTLNNTVENLEWATSHENMKHAYNTGLMPKAKANNERAKKPIVTDRGEHFSCAYECAAKLGVTPGTVRDALKGRIKTVRGRKVTYLEREWGQSNG